MDQKEQGVIISRIEREYSFLEQSHQSLRESYDKMRRREKKKDKFFTCMWKGVKGPWKVLKPKERLSSPRTDSNNEILTRWYEDGDPQSDNNDEETASDGST